MEVIVDRIEKDFLVVEIEKGQVLNLPKVLVPDAQEGDVISITKSSKKTTERKKKIDDLVQELFK